MIARRSVAAAMALVPGRREQKNRFDRKGKALVFAAFPQCEIEAIPVAVPRSGRADSRPKLLRRGE
jgi:hypothetical protein